MRRETTEIELRILPFFLSPGQRGKISAGVEFTAVNRFERCTLLQKLRGQVSSALGVKSYRLVSGLTRPMAWRRDYSIVDSRHD